MIAVTRFITEDSGATQQIAKHLLSCKDKKKLTSFVKCCGSKMLLKVATGPYRPSYWIFHKGPRNTLTVEIKEQFFRLPEV